MGGKDDGKGKEKYESGRDARPCVHGRRGPAHHLEQALRGGDVLLSRLRFRGAGLFHGQRLYAALPRARGLWLCRAQGGPTAGHRRGLACAVLAAGTDGGRSARGLFPPLDDRFARRVLRQLFQQGLAFAPLVSVGGGARIRLPAAAHPPARGCGICSWPCSAWAAR